MVTQLEDLTTFAKAAKACHIRRSEAQRIALAAGIAVRWGAGWRVKVSELAGAILSRRNTTVTTAKRRTPRPSRRAARPGTPASVAGDVRC